MYNEIQIKYIRHKTKYSILSHSQSAMFDVLRTVLPYEIYERQNRYFMKTAIRLFLDNALSTYNVPCTQAGECNGGKCRNYYGEVRVKNCLGRDSFLALTDYSADQIDMQTGSLTYAQDHFEREDGTSLYLSCSAILSDRLFIFGGELYPQQVSEITKCGIKRRATLPFALVGATCKSFKIKIYEVALLCFPITNSKSCYSWGEINREKLSDTPTSGYNETNYRHYDVELTSFHNKPIIIGGYHNTAMEKFDGDIWIDEDEHIKAYPTYTAIKQYAAISSGNSVFIFGGVGYLYGVWIPLSEVYRYSIPKPKSDERHWNKIGQLKGGPRMRHSVIGYKDQIFIFGGIGYDSKNKTEVWSTIPETWDQEHYGSDHYRGFDIGPGPVEHHSMQRTLLFYAGYLSPFCHV